jgi:tRNA pseudouridine38-40 synthase
VPRFKLTIEYAGTRYSGWQIQTNARTVQGEIDRAARTVTARHDFELYGSGRTDAGVHAIAQIAHLDVATTVPADTLRRRLNDELPADINILAAEQVPHRFHARHDAVARRYLYQIARRRTAFAKPYVWWVKEPLDAARMRRAAAAFTGMRDFLSFAARDDRSVRLKPDATSVRTERPDRPERGVRLSASAKSFGGRAVAFGEGGQPDRSVGSAGRPEPDDEERSSTLVLIDRLDITEDGDLVLVAIEGSHFLWKMVRRIVGVLVEIGRGGLEPEAAATFLSESSTAPARLTAPPSGLFLERVFYRGDRRDKGRAQPVTPLLRTRAEG